MTEKSPTSNLLTTAITEVGESTIGERPDAEGSFTTVAEGRVRVPASDDVSTENRTSRGFTDVIESEPDPGSFRGPLVIEPGMTKEEIRELRRMQARQRKDRSGSAAVIQKAWRERKKNRLRAFTAGQLEEKKALEQFSMSFQAIQEIRSRAVKWEDLTDMKQIASGMFGDVMIAKFKSFTVVVKTLKVIKIPRESTREERKRLEEDQELADQDFKKEMSMLTKLWHCNIVHLIGVGVKPKLFMVMEYMSGGSLQDVLKEAREQQLPIDPFQIIKWSLDMAQGMKYLHEAFPRILHRDLKPANLLISAPVKIGDLTQRRRPAASSDNQDESKSQIPELKIADFGLSRVLGPTKKESNERYRLTGGTGSLRYMAPEVASNQPYNEKADVYGFGIIFWEMVANDLPYKKLRTSNFYEEVVRKQVRPPIDEHWPIEIKQLCTDCWSTDPLARPTFREVVQRLENIRDNTSYCSQKDSSDESDAAPTSCCTIS